MPDTVGLKTTRGGVSLDPLTVLLSALSLPTEQASSARSVGLTSTLVQKFGSHHPKLEATLAEYAADPETYREPARKVLREVGADRDQAVVDQAANLLNVSEQAQPGITGGLVGQLNAQGGRILVAQSITGNVYQGDVAIYATTTLDPRERENRRRMLQRVRRTWIDDFLEDSLHGAALQTLGLEERPDAVPDRWGMVVQQPERADRALALGTSIVQVFDELDGELLILGEPGSGKTTLLLELMRALLDRAEHDDALPMPIVFPLAPWAAKRSPLADWLVDELNQRYDVPRNLGQAWVAAERILPLFDGLDEVAAEHRAGCVAAINAFRQSRTTALLSLAVTSRLTDYAALGPQLQLRGAVLLRPLEPEQIDAYLASAGQQLAGVHAAVRADAVLQELARSPLLLSTMTLAYRDVPDGVLPTRGTIDERRTQLFATYVEAMFARRGVETRYSQEQTRHWLTWLAHGLARQSQTIFFLDRLQPDWLAAADLRRRYVLADRLGGALLCAVLLGCLGVLARGLLAGLAEGLAAGLVAGLFGEVTERSSGYRRGVWPSLRGATGGWLLIALIGGLVCALLSIGAAAISQGRQTGGFWAGLSGMLTYAPAALIATALGGALAGLTVAPAGALAGILDAGPMVRPRRVAVVETIRWSARKAASQAVGGLITGLLLGCVDGLVFGLLLGLSEAPAREQPAEQLARVLGSGLIGALFAMVTFAPLGGLIGGLLGGLVGGEVETKVVPNQGIRRSGRVAIVLGLVVALLLGLAYGQVATLLDVSDHSLSSALVVGLLFGLVVGLAYGGYACLSHLALRLVLWRAGALPLDTIRFLDHAAERIFLRKVGGGYIFVHRLLQDYFAALEGDTEGQTSTDLTPAV